MNFNKKEYDRNYMKERRKELKTFKVDLPTSEKEELDLLLEQHRLSKVEFLKKAIANYKEELKMKKYYVNCGTQHYEKVSSKWCYQGDTSMNAIDGHIARYDSYEEAIKAYNNIELQCDKSNDSIYADYKELYEYYSTHISDDDIDDGNFNFDDLKLLQDDYSYTD